VSKTFWRVAIVGFVVINVGGMIYAAMMGELMHGIVHVAVLGAGFVAAQFVRGGKEARVDLQAPVDERVLDSLQESIDAIALNVERIGEDQRFQAKLVKERMDQAPGHAVEPWNGNLRLHISASEQPACLSEGYDSAHSERRASSQE
jgi:hypothetical protein